MQLLSSSSFRSLSSLSIVIIFAATISSSGETQASYQNQALKKESNAVVNSNDSILVSNKEEFKLASAHLKPGQVITLADGTWHDFEIFLSGDGTKNQPIKLQAQTEGKVILSGQSNLRLQGRYLEVSGLVFKDGYSPTGVVIEFRGDSQNLAYQSRVTRTVIDGFSNPDKFNSDNWVALYGKHNRFDHNHLVGKNNAGVTMAVRLNTENSQENHHRIDHNYFGPRPILGSNGGETLRIGTSHYSLSNSFTVVENNYFDRANGEVEIISNKSGKNIFRNNVFFESRGTLTLRHGNGNVVEGNVFFGNNKDHTGGIRVINAGQTIRNNYMEGLTGIRFGGGFVILNGVPNSTINRYHQVNNAVIENNTIVNVSNINLAAGSDAERTAVPVNSLFANNLVFNQNTEQAFKIFDDVSGISFTNNLSNQAVPSVLSKGFDVKNIDLVRNKNGLLVLADNTINNVGASPSLKPTNKADTGVSWYAKAGAEVAFNSAQTLTVGSTEQLYKAIASAPAGTRIELASGEYELKKQLQVNTVLSLAGQANSKVVLFPMRSLTFELEDGGNLQLSNLTIDGARAPDSAGNVIIRSTRLPTLLNYRLALNHITIRNLNVNHSFHVFDAGYRSMADSITISHSNFENITGDILRLDKEQDDLGIYNAEYLTIEQSKFTNIEGAIAKVYRGGTDESTFGPHFNFMNNTVVKVGAGKRNKNRACLFLHGVQDTDIINNTFKDCKAVTIDHTVGEPQTLIENNQFMQTPMPIVTEVFTKGESTAVMQNNKTK